MSSAQSNFGIGAFLRSLRESRSFSIDEVAGLAKLPLTTIEEMEGALAHQFPLCEIYSVLMALKINEREYASFSVLIDAAMSQPRNKSQRS
jgi:transcriptional regulator with XRE-family HTH domain